MYGGISKDNKIPWKCPVDMKWFVNNTRSTKKNRKIVIMGRKTFESIGKALPERINIVVSASAFSPNDMLAAAGEGVLYVKSFAAAIERAKLMYENSQESLAPVSDVFVIGGARLFRDAIVSPYLDKLLIGIITDPAGVAPDTANGGYDCDVFMFGDKEDTQEMMRKIFIEFIQLTENKQLVDVWPNVDAVNDSSLPQKKLLTHFEFTRRDNPEEMKYLSLVNKIMRTGTLTPTRTGIQTVSVFSKKLKFSLTDGNKQSQFLTGHVVNITGRKLLPLLTTKRIPYITVCNELIWFIRGDDNVKFLHEKGVKIWDGNTSRQYLDSKQLTNYAEGETGPIYGVQWRGWNTPNGSKVDQLAKLINGIMTNPYSRRHVLTAWNVADIDKMCLPPCHLMSIWKVDADESGAPTYLSCHVLMRSADIFLGVPFNIASYATLTHLIAEICGLKAKKLAVDMVDCHIYENHLQQCEEQLQRTPIFFPSLEFSENLITLIEEFKSHVVHLPTAAVSENMNTMDVNVGRIKSLLDIIGRKINGRDFIPRDYISWDAIKAPMAV